MSDFNQDMQNLLNAYDSNWDDYLALRKQFIEKYSLSVEKLQEIRVEELKDFNSKILQAELKNQELQEQLNAAKKALTEIDSSRYGMQFRRDRNPNVARQALAAIGGKND